MKLRTLSQIRKLKGKRVLLRVDFNVRVGSRGEIGKDDDDRIRASIPTIRHLVDHGARVIIVSHLGRPKAKERSLSLLPAAKLLEEHVHVPIRFVAESLDDGDAVEKHLVSLKDGDIAMLENIRFYKGEEKNSVFLARRLASFADLFVDDAFSVAHRAHASNVGVTALLPSYAGFLMQQEVTQLGKVLARPKKPFIVLVGGVKIETKLPVIRNLLPLADAILVGGGMANNFFKAKGKRIGASIYSRKDVALAKSLMSNRKIKLPIDVLVADAIEEGAKVRVTTPDDIRAKDRVVDIGPETMRAYAKLLKSAKTIVWNGPMGVHEIRRFANGSLILARVIAARSSGRAFGVVGGGDTLPVIAKTGMGEFIDHISTGGGAMLDFLGGKPMPGIEPLIDGTARKRAPAGKKPKGKAVKKKKR
jgi:3-phosphoglycerate kinase